MALTPLDIHNKEFNKKLLRGYDPDEVDEFLDQIIRDFEALIKDHTHLREQVEALTAKLDQYQMLEDTLNRTLIVAQETADELKANARKESDLIIQEARLQAERIIEGGHAKARRILEENEDLQKSMHILRSQVRAMLRAQLEILERTVPDVAEAPAASAAVVKV